MEEAKTTIYLVFAYSSKDAHYYYQLSSLDQNNGQSVNDSDDIRLVSFDKLFKRTYTGGIYETAQKESGSYSYNKDRMPCDNWKNQNDRATWRTKQSAYDEEGKLMKALKENDLIEMLEPARAAYASANYSQRRLILAEVIRIITKGIG